MLALRLQGSKPLDDGRRFGEGLFSDLALLEIGETCQVRVDRGLVGQVIADGRADLLSRKAGELFGYLFGGVAALVEIDDVLESDSMTRDLDLVRTGELEVVFRLHRSSPLTVRVYWRRSSTNERPASSPPQTRAHAWAA